MSCQIRFPVTGQAVKYPPEYSDSMCAGYQAAMMESNAKYKVYLHQDLFIINKNFISDVIKIFREEKEYGMLGVMGSTKMHANARYWDHWDIGETFASMPAVSGIAWRRDVVGQVEPVVAVDGMILITQYDVNWREDIFTDFDFYDISQCMEFTRAGYKVGVLHQETPWCMHDCGHSKFDNYEMNRKKFCETYQMLGYAYEEDREMIERVMTKKQLDIRMVKVEEAFERNAYVEAIKLVQENLNLSLYHTKCCYYSVILEILMEECRLQNPIFSFSESYLPKDLLLEYQKLRFLIMRLEFGLAIDDYEAEWARKPEHMPEWDIIIRHTALQVDVVRQLVKDMNTAM